MQAFCARSLRAFQVGQIITLDLFLLPLFGIYVIYYFLDILYTFPTLRGGGGRGGIHSIYIALPEWGRSTSSRTPMIWFTAMPP